MRGWLVGCGFVGFVFRDFGVGVWLGFVGGSPKKSVECFGSILVRVSRVEQLLGSGGVGCAAEM